MNTYADKRREDKSQSVANAVSQKSNGNGATFKFVDNRPEAVAQRKLQDGVMLPLASHNSKHMSTLELSLCRDSELSWNISNKFFCHIGDRTHDSKCDVQ